MYKNLVLYIQFFYTFIANEQISLFSLYVIKQTVLKTAIQRRLEGTRSRVDIKYVENSVHLLRFSKT